MSTHKIHIPAPYIHPVFTDDSIDTPVSTAAPFPVVVRDTRLIAVNDTAPFVPSLSASTSSGHTDLFGNTGGSRANIGIAVGSTGADIVIPDPWRIRRFIIVCSRTGSGSTNVSIACALWGRLLTPDGTSTPWRSVSESTDTASGIGRAIRFSIPGSLTGVFGFDQYRITFRREPDSTPAPELSLIRVYAEFA
jgi:hypothetical protein